MDKFAVCVLQLFPQSSLLKRSIQEYENQAATTFGKLRKRTCSIRRLTFWFIRPVCLALSYMDLKCGQHMQGFRKKKLDSFHLRSLYLKWQDKITNSEVLQRAKLPSIIISSNRRPRWLRHMIRMDGSSTPKKVLYVKLWRKWGHMLDLIIPVSHQCEIFCVC